MKRTTKTALAASFGAALMVSLASPSLAQQSRALVRDQFIISSSVGLCRDLIDHLQGATEAQPRGTNLALELDFAAVAEGLDLNRDYFLARRVQEGRTPDQAQQEVDMALQVLRYVEALSLTTRGTDQTLQACLKGTWQ